LQKSGWERFGWILAYIRRKVAGVAGEDPKIFLGPNVRCKMKVVKEDAYKEDWKRKREFENHT
jgi:hypothetical protein